MTTHINRFWLSSVRMYSASLEFDLLGDLMLTTRWGGRHNRRGGLQIKQFGSFEEGLRALDAVDRRRRSHGYVEQPACHS
jgi:predicted DNA-binding WGR domain protein